MAATQRYLQPPEEATGCLLPGGAPPHLATSDQPPLEGLLRAIARPPRRRRSCRAAPSRSRPSSRIVATWLSKYGPSSVRHPIPGPGAPERRASPRAHRGERAREAGPHHPALLPVERVSVGGADRLEDPALDPGVGTELDLGEVGVMDVAGEDRRSRPAPCLGDRSRPPRAASRRRWNENWNAAQWSKSTARRRRSLPRATGRAPGAVAEPLVPGLEVVEAWVRAGRGPWSPIRRWSKSPLDVIDDPVPHLVVEHRAPLLRQHPRGAGVDEDRPHPVDVAVEAPASAGAGRVDLACAHSRSTSVASGLPRTRP